MQRVDGPQPHNLRGPTVFQLLLHSMSRCPFLELQLLKMLIPWTARRSNWSILKEISPERSLEGLMSNTLAT